MRTVIFKPVMLVLFFLATSVASLNAINYIDSNKGTIEIELRPGFTIEDIIQDLHGNANINVSSVHTGGNIYTLMYNVKVVDIITLKQFLDAHPGVDILLSDCKY
jgi:hypothetical protein